MEFRTPDTNSKQTSSACGKHQPQQLVSRMPARHDNSNRIETVPGLLASALKTNLRDLRDRQRPYSSRTDMKAWTPKEDRASEYEHQGREQRRVYRTWHSATDPKGTCGLAIRK